MNTPLKKLIDEHNLKAEQVALMLNVSAYSIQAWARGQRPMPNNLMELLTLKLKQEQS